MLAPNIILQDRYRIVRLLGKGGMGAVYEAIDQRVSCLVALKEYTVGAQSEARQAFQREAALLANLRHSALPKVMDYFSESQGDFLVMEFIPGHDLAELLALRGGAFPADQVVRWAIELLKLLEYLHTRDPPILHRDIKPANLKVTKLDEVFLLDFGLAKGAAGQMATIETSQSVPGYTPVYAPIEQILGQGTDPRSDLYSLAATLYHLLTGQAPVSAPARFDAIENDRPDPLPAANKLNSLVTSDIATVVRGAMALSRKDRPSSASEMRATLEQSVQAAADSDAARARAEADLIKTLPYPAEVDPARPLVTDKDVQFTVYTPQRIKPEKNYPVLAFAHLSKRRADAPDDEPDPIEEMKDQAARILGTERDDYGDAKDASRRPVPRGGELTFVPVIQGVTFSPPSRNFTWRKSVHREDFDMWAAREVDGQTLKGRMTIFLGSVIIAEVELTIIVDSHAVPSAEKISLDQGQSARRLRQIFASYSNQDEQVVAELAQVAPIFGSRYLTDRTHLDPGEDRAEGLQRLIRDADVFQLFWSTNSMRSAEIADEIKYAISLRRPGFILPTYWEEPVPRNPAAGLPPPEIERLHFHRIYPGAISQATFGAADQRSPAIAAPISFASAPASAPQAEPENAPTGALPPLLQTMRAPLPAFGDMSPRGSLPPGVVACTRCGARYAAGIRLCGRCGGTTSSEVNAPAESINAMAAPAEMPQNQVLSPAVFAATSPQSPVPMVVARRRNGLLMPIFAGAAMVLLVVIVAPIWFMMNSKSSVSESRMPSSNTASNAANRNTGNPAPLAKDSQLAPDAQFSSLDGGMLRLKDFQGRVVLLNFWTTWAAPSRKEIPVLNQLQKDLGPRGLSVIGISYDDTADAVRQFQKEVPQDYQIGLGGKQVAAQLQSLAFPTTYLIDRRGRIRKKMVGGQTRAAFEAAIEPLLSEAP